MSKIFRCLFSVLHHALYLRSSIHLSSTPSAPTYVQLKARFIGPVLTNSISANSFHDIRQHTQFRVLQHPQANFTEHSNNAAKILLIFDIRKYFQYFFSIYCTFNLFLHFSLFSLLCINLSFLHIVESNKSSL